MKMMTTKDIYRQYLALGMNVDDARRDFNDATTAIDIEIAGENLVWCEKRLKKFENKMWEEV